MRKQALIIGTALTLALGALGAVNAEKEKSEIKPEVAAQLEKNIQEFKNEVDTDIIQSFKLDLTKFDKIDHKDVMQKDEYANLRKAFIRVAMEQSEGDIMPSIYLQNKNTAYILEKKSDGSNVVHEFKLKGDKWEATDVKKSKGKIIKFKEIQN
jgi:F0F1-type ATP synthase delta subunit